MHIAFVSDSETRGGAGVSAARLADGLSRAGHTVTWVTATPDGLPHPWRTVRLTRSTGERVLGRLLPVETGLPARLARHQLAACLAALRPDVVHFHNLHGARWAGWSPELVRAAAPRFPTVWTLHDMWSFTGRCAYAYECPRFRSGCDARCPTPEEYPALPPRRIRRAWAGRQRLLADHPELIAVTPSRWLAREAAAGLWQRHRVEVIPYGLPLDVYRPTARQAARRTLGLPDDGPFLLLASLDLTERRKGLGLLGEALARLGRPEVRLMTMGRGELRLPGGLTAGVHALGHVDREEIKVAAYAAADLLVHPALADNLPNVVLEALACGTPVVGFAVGGLPEPVQPGRTGWLAPSVSAAGLAGALADALGDLARGVDRRPACRETAEAAYGLGRQAERHVTLYQGLLDGWRRGPQREAGDSTRRGEGR